MKKTIYFLFITCITLSMLLFACNTGEIVGVSIDTQDDEELDPAQDNVRRSLTQEEVDARIASGDGIDPRGYFWHQTTRTGSVLYTLYFWNISFYVIDRAVGEVAIYEWDESSETWINKDYEAFSVYNLGIGRTLLDAAFYNCTSGKEYYLEYVSEIFENGQSIWLDHGYEYYYP